MTKRKKIIGVTIMLIIYFVILAIGFFIVYLLKTNTHPANNTTNTVAPSPSITKTVPTGFKTYENPKQKFSMSYPETLDITEKSYGFGVNTIELRSNDNANTSDLPNVQVLTVPKSIAKMIGQDFDMYYQMQPNETKIISGELQGKKEEQKFTKIKNRTVNGMRAVEYTSVPNPNPKNYEAELGIFIENGDDIVMFVTGENERDQLEEIIATYSPR